MRKPEALAEHPAERSPKRTPVMERRDADMEHEAARRGMALSLKASMEEWGGKAKTLASSKALHGILAGCGVYAVEAFDPGRPNDQEREVRQWTTSS